MARNGDAQCSPASPGCSSSSASARSLVLSTGLPVPGPVVGMVLLVRHAGRAQRRERIVAGVGIGPACALVAAVRAGRCRRDAALRSRYRANGCRSSLALLVSTVLTLAATALVMRWLLARQERHADERETRNANALQPLSEIWVYLAATPLARPHADARRVRRQAAGSTSRCGMHPLLNPVLLAVAMHRGAAVARDAHVLSRRTSQARSSCTSCWVPRSSALAVPLASAVATTCAGWRADRRRDSVGRIAGRGRQRRGAWRGCSALRR